ncbi:arginine N-succinyltransferase [Fluoribacter gormanii]|uniref:Arginine N-succinyltransferase n=1 Tax=Fluoribacter gormanii TaxID=464 RepID=A0A377GJL5_9GAMM|nr:arginine N-succinyltransferase [Fluoribacter gormanii]KTD00384.1 arginine N-succinyltransferase, beta chain [Fluoribacter gormanii]MCW8443684.1 arginine N-succinyltransferase [Fluoribacter gormanii]MCW8472113.1 arginine N-succinyltransferase [Fluoribacter gormanii]SIQ93685.1 arginine N-succinyltransferase [Fluoribacter gormanii]STO24763.1 Arginine N-succinyltransferase subunit beta [Fluoribacter gormanii]
MMLFRSACNADLDAIHHLAEESGVGITTLSKDKEILAKRILWSSDSFKKNIEKPNNEYYLFVLENPKSKKIIGVSGIESCTGHEAPFYSYKISKRTRICRSLNIRSDYEVLSLVNDNQGRSEICTLFLEPKYRKNKNGLLLSKARFLFIAQHPQRFASTVIAEMRGISDANGISPFWDNVGSHFFHMSFADADRLTLATDKQFIADLMPRNPIYIKLLSPEAQAVIGESHPSTQAAMKILLKEGFRYNKYVDIFDAGPTLEVPLSKIKTIELSRVVTIKNISDEVSSANYLLANTQLDFRATVNSVLVNKENNTCIISKKTANLLQVKCGNQLRIAPLQFDSGEIND